MEGAMSLDFEAEIRRTVEIGNPWALDDLIEETCGVDAELAGVVRAVVADEYIRRLAIMSPKEMNELYEEYYLEPTDANKDWLLGEIVESIRSEG